MLMTLMLVASFHCPDMGGGKWLRNCDPNREVHSRSVGFTGRPNNPGRNPPHDSGPKPGTPGGKTPTGGSISTPETPGGGGGGCTANCGPTDPGNPPGKKHGNASANNGKGGNYERTGHDDNGKGQGRNRK